MEYEKNRFISWFVLFRWQIQKEQDSDKTFRIEEYNYYMDNFAKKRDPKIMEGTLTDEEFAS